MRVVTYFPIDVFPDKLVAVVPEMGWPGGPLAPQIFGRSVNPILTGRGQIMPNLILQNCEWPKAIRIKVKKKPTTTADHYPQESNFSKPIK